MNTQSGKRDTEVLKRNRRIRFQTAVALVTVALALGGFYAVEASAAGNIQVVSPDDWLKLSSRLVFSTVAERPTPARSITINNNGTGTLNVTNLVISGSQASQFQLAAGQPTSFAVPQGGSASVSLLFVPVSGSGGPQRIGNLAISTNDADTPTFNVVLKGLDAVGYEGIGEPQLNTIFSTLGYSTNPGITGPNQQKTRVPAGDEVTSPYWRIADTTKTATIRPLARYVALTTSTEASGVTNTVGGHFGPLFQFPSDDIDNHVYVENQKLLPQVQAGGTFTIPPNTPAPFGFYAAWINNSDDAYNNSTPQGEPVGTEHFHNIRFWPAKAGGVAIPNTYLMGVDVKLDPTKNYDYQDQLLLVTNIRPDLTPDAALGTRSNLQFDAAKAGTVADTDGQGTGFNSVLGTSTPSLVDLNTGTGQLTITSTAGQVTGSGNDQANGMQINFDGTRAGFRSVTKILNPGTDLTAGFQQKAIYFAPGQDDYVKLEIEHRTTNEVWITMLREEGGISGTVAQFKVNNPTSFASLELALDGDVKTGAVRGSYRLSGSDDFTTLGTYFPANVMKFFSAKARTGILVSHTGSTTPIHGVFDSFVASVSTK